MATTIVTKHEDGDATDAPVTLSEGELAVNTQAQKLWVGPIGGGSPVPLIGAGIPDGTNSQTLRYGTTSWEATSDIVVLDNGNVGIGTSSPPSQLSVTTAAGGESLRLTDGTNSTLTIRHASPNSQIQYEAGGVASHVWIGNSTERMRINSTGNVGIGADPGTWTGSLGALLTLDFTGVANQEYQGITFVAGNANGRGYINFERGAVSTQGSLIFGTSNTERMRIDSAGNVGIGTDSPLNRLDVIDTIGSSGLQMLVKRNVAGDFVSRIGLGNSFVNNGWYVGGSGNSMTFGGLSDLTQESGGFVTERMRIDSSGNLLVGTTTVVNAGVAGVQLNSGNNTRQFGANTALSFNQILFKNTNDTVGVINTTGSATSYITSSDVRLKENIQDAADPFAKINAIQVREFDWKTDGSHQDFGFIAQELVEVAPEAVSQGETEEDTWGVDPSKLVPVLVKAIQEQQEQIDELRALIGA